MTWYGALLQRLRDTVGVTALIGNRSFWETAPQNTSRPYVTLLDVTEDRPQTFSGFDLESGRIQIDVWADSYLSKNDVMEAVIAALLDGGTFDGHIFQRAEVAIGPRDVSGEREGSTPLYRKTADLIIPHRPA